MRVWMTETENEKIRTEPEPGDQNISWTEPEPKKVGSFRSLMGDDIYFILYPEPYQLTHTHIHTVS